MKRTDLIAVRDAATGEPFAFTMTYDVTPAPGTVVDDLGHGIAIVRRDPPARPDLPGADWVAPFAANCDQHGHIASRASLGQAREEARAHIAAEHRTLDAGRRAQGFRSQEQLDAHYAYTDHVRACAECDQPGPAFWLEGSASWQPTMRQCAEGRRLDRASLAFLA